MFLSWETEKEISSYLKLIMPVRVKVNFMLGNPKASREGESP
jgi:succinylglutamate desuccinylase